MIENLKKFLIGSAILACSMQNNFGMESESINLKLENMLKNTKEQECENLYTDAVNSAMSEKADIAKIEKSLIKESNEGNYLAQYYLAEYYGTLAKDKYNEEKFLLEQKKAILLLISSIKADFWRSTEELVFALNNIADEQYLISLKEKKEKEIIEKVESLADQLALSGKL